MGVHDAMAMVAVVTVLVGEGVGKMKAFTFDSFTFVPIHFYVIALKFTDGKITAIYDSKAGSTATYDTSQNRFEIGFLSASNESRRALIIHEATHAVCDFFSARMDIATSESIAYIAQCVYARANSTSTDPDARLYSSDAAKDKVFEIGWRIAGKILGGGSVDSTDCNDMRAAVKGHPLYAKNATDLAVYDGT
jgi:hypothetical protein